MNTPTTTFYEALFAAQSEMASLKKDRKNPFFNSTYADLRQVLEVMEGPLSKHGFIVNQMPISIEGHHILRTRVVHCKSGEGEVFDTPLQMKDSKTTDWGAALTYARRNSLKTYFCMDEEDTDGMAKSSSPHRAMAPRPAVAMEKKSPVTSLRSDDYVLQTGQQKGMTLKEVPEDDLFSYRDWLASKQPLKGKAVADFEALEAFLQGVESEPSALPEHMQEDIPF